MVQHFFLSFILLCSPFYHNQDKWHILVTQAYSHSVTAYQGKATLNFWLDRRVTKWNEFEEAEDNE